MSSISPAMELVMALSLLQSQLLKKMDHALSPHGISLTEFLVMFHLHSAPGKTMRRIHLAENVGLSASGVTRLLLPMEKNKLVQKEVNPRDARVSLVKLSRAGERIYNEALVSFESAAGTLFQPLGQRQVAQFLELAKGLI